MDNGDKTKREYYTIDVLHIARYLWSRAWIVALLGLLLAIGGFLVATFLVTPEYSSSIMLYVNNSSFSLGNTSFSISSSEITAAQSLVKTYGEILNNRTTLEKVLDKAELTDKYDYKKLGKMISSSPSNDTEIMLVTVTSEDPYEAAKIANCIAEVLPIRINEIIKGASMEVVDSAIPHREKISPSITQYTAIGLVLGLLIAMVALVVAALLDDTIHDEDYVLQTYDYPILAKVPNLLDSNDNQYGYYAQSNDKSKKN